MKPFAIVAMVAGLAVIVILVVVFGAPMVAAALVRLGPLGFSAVCLAHAPVLAILAGAWRACIPTGVSVRFRSVIAARLLREAAAETLPFSDLGGFAIGMRALALAGVSGVAAVASTLVDLTAEALAQLGFLWLGLAAIYRLRPDAPLIRPAATTLLVLVATIAAAIVATRRGGKIVAPALAMVRSRLARFGSVDAVLAMTFALLRRSRAFALASLIHLAGWLALAGEAWFALRLIGAETSYVQVLALEAALFATRSLAFFMPAALGVQEGAYALFAPMLGIDVPDVLALSLVKRARNIVIGAPALLLWERVEASRQLRKR
ncbi:MAG TPA: lysylphosphatidylglycerol synthase domain-containing protein [Roseiarcus sp.]|nr:lysylphosphatidylglycerol synthase domain-containing protein [Roseiarcus sp.]